MIYIRRSGECYPSTENSDSTAKRSVQLLQMSTEDKLSCHCVKEMNTGSINIGETFAQGRTLKVETDVDMTFSCGS